MAFFESQVDDAMVFGSLHGEQDVLHLPLVERFHFDSDSLVEGSLDRDCLVMLKVLVCHEINKQVLPRLWLFWLIFVRLFFDIFNICLRDIRARADYDWL
jgi:hypothetical protein